MHCFVIKCLFYCCKVVNDSYDQCLGSFVLFLEDKGHTNVIMHWKLFCSNGLKILQSRFRYSLDSKNEDYQCTTFAKVNQIFDVVSFPLQSVLPIRVMCHFHLRKSWRDSVHHVGIDSPLGIVWNVSTHSIEMPPTEKAKILLMSFFIIFIKSA